MGLFLTKWLRVVYISILKGFRVVMLSYELWITNYQWRITNYEFGGWGAIAVSKPRVENLLLSPLWWDRCANSRFDPDGIWCQRQFVAAQLRIWSLREFGRGANSRFDRCANWGFDPYGNWGFDPDGIWCQRQFVAAQLRIWLLCKFGRGANSKFPLKSAVALRVTND